MKCCRTDSDLAIMHLFCCYLLYMTYNNVKLSTRFSSQVLCRSGFKTMLLILNYLLNILRRSQWPRGLRRRSRAARLLRSWVRIPPAAWMPVCCECCVLSGRGLCDELTTRPEESYRLWCVVVCDIRRLEL